LTPQRLDLFIAREITKTRCWISHLSYPQGTGVADQSAVAHGALPGIDGALIHILCGIKRRHQRANWGLINGWR